MRARSPRPCPTSFATIRAATLLRFSERLDMSDRQVQSLFRRHGLSVGQIVDPYSVLPLVNYIGFLEEAAALTGDALIGARMGQGYRPADIGPIGILFSISPSLRVAFSRLAKLLPAFQARTSVALLSEGDTMAWVYKINDPHIWPRRQDSEYAISATCAMVRSSCGSNWCPIEVRFEHEPPADPAVEQKLRAIFRAPVLFRQPTNALLLDIADIDKVRHAEDRDLALVLERHITDLLGKTEEEPSIRSAVLTVLGIHMGHSQIAAPMIAAALGMPVRTLQRRLADEGLSLRMLVREQRTASAQQRLSMGDVSIGQLAETLGYADSTSFSRAFREWTGAAPTHRRGEAGR